VTAQPDVTVFTDNEFASLIGKRFAAINQGFDRIRGRSRGVERKCSSLGSRLLTARRSGYSSK
jgi:hypothetical protein